jgi:hypothetical protein
MRSPNGGAFQTSWNLHTASPLLPELFADYMAKPDGFLSIFQEGMVAGHNDLANFGGGGTGRYSHCLLRAPALCSGRAFPVPTRNIAATTPRFRCGANACQGICPMVGEI